MRSVAYSISLNMHGALPCLRLCVFPTDVCLRYLNQDPVCYPYNLGYVQDLAYFEGIRFFVSKHKETKVYYKPNPDVRPTKGKAKILWYDFFDWLETNRPLPLSEIRTFLTNAAKWFTDPVSNSCSYAAVKDQWDKRWAKAQADYIAAGSPKKGLAEERYKLEKEAYDEISSTTKYKNFFEVNMISFVVAKQWDALSDVDNALFPVAADWDSDIKPGTLKKVGVLLIDRHSGEGFADNRVSYRWTINK